MRASQVVLWYGLILLHHSVDGLPTAFSYIDPANDVRRANVESVDYCQHPRAEVEFDHGLGPVLARSTTPPKKGGNVPTVPQNPVKDKGKGKQDTSTNDGNNGKTPDPQTPASRPQGGEKVTIFQLGECGKEISRDSIENKDAKGGSPQRPQPKTPKPPKTPAARKARKRPAKANDDDPPPVSGKKSMAVCGSKVDNMIFPDYPSSGDAIEVSEHSVYWKTKLVAYNAVDEDPCNNNYKFGKRPTYPREKKEGIHTPQKEDKKGGKQHTRDIWETEHVMDAQIMKLFFQDMFQSIPADLKKSTPKKDANIERSEIPARWVSSDKGKAASQDQCNYLEQFWMKRWAPKQDAMKYLLSVYPGSEDHQEEMLLLPGRLNNKKAKLFGLEEYDVIDPDRFAKIPFHQKIDELREVILLLEYLDTPVVAGYFKAVSERIRNRLAEIDADGDDAYMRKTDDWWFKQRKANKNEEEQTLRDATDEKYRSVGLASRWSKWINAFVKQRIEGMQYLLLELTYELEKDWEVAKTYTELRDPNPKRKAFKEDFEIRLKALKDHTGKTVNLKSYVIGSVSRPGTPQLPDSEDSGNESSDPGVPETPTRPTKPKPNNEFSLPDRTKPQAGPSTLKV